MPPKKKVFKSVTHYKTRSPLGKAYFSTGTGEEFIVDPEDAESVSRFTWSADKDGYLNAVVNTPGERVIRIKLHRFVLSAKDDEVVDHINHDPMDNRKGNLRISNKSLNGINRKKSKCRSNTGHLGVSIVRGLYVARINQKVNGKRKVHYFSSKVLEEAVEWADKKREEILNGKL